MLDQLQREGENFIFLIRHGLVIPFHDPRDSFKLASAGGE